MIPLRTLLLEYSGLTPLAANTLRLHECGIVQYEKTIGGAAGTLDFSDARMAKHTGRRLADGCARATVNAEVCKLLALWRFAAKHRYVEKWPTVKAPKMPERVALAWTQAELARVFAAVQLAGPVGDVPGYQWWTALLSCLFDSGERITAMLALEWSGVDLEGGTLLLPAEVRKGQTCDRLYRIAADTAERLAVLPRDRSPFHWPYCLGTLWGRYKRMLQAAGLPCDRRSKFHRIRRSTASHYEAAGGNATELLGHSSRKVTVKSYLDPRICGPPSAIDLLFRPGT